MIRIALLLALTCTAFAADMVHQRVTLKGGEELVGWWCADQGVLYLDNGKRRLIDKPAEQVAKAEAVPTEQKAPARKQFTKPSQLPYGRISIGDAATYLGWYHEPSGRFFAEDGAEPFYDLKATKLVAELPAPGPVPSDAVRYATAWAVEFDG